MSTYNIATAVNIDSLTSKAGSDTYNILNGGYLTVDQDTRYGTNGNTSAAMGNITMAAGGACTVEFNATKVRWLRFTSGSGSIPSSNTTIGQASTGASGLLIGVYTSTTSAPSAAGGGMPAGGYLKIKQWNDIEYDATALTGITATAFGASVVGWIEIVGVDAFDCTINRLNTFKVRGEWFDLGTTDGNSSTTYQIPTSGSSVIWLSGVWVETGTETNVYEFYPHVAPISALRDNVATDAVRGKVCWISTGGLLKFQNDGANTTGGYLPPTGRRIRIPNIFFYNCTAAAPTANVLPNSTLTTRYSFVTTGGGVVDVDRCCMNWWMNFLQPYSVSLLNVTTFEQVLVQEVASPMTWQQVGIGLTTPANAQSALSMSLCFAGGTITDCKWGRHVLGASGAYNVLLSDISGFTFTRNYFNAHAFRGHATTGVGSFTRVADCHFDTCTFGVGRTLLTTCSDLDFDDSIYYDHPATTTTTAYGHYMFDMATRCSNIKIDGVTFGGLTLCQPYNGIMNVGAAGCSGVKLRNLGTFASPLDLGGSQVDATWTRVTTTASITSTDHGLKVGDNFYVLVSSDTAAITVAAKTVLAVTSKDVFTVTCLGAGATSGTLTYYPLMSAYLFALATGAAAKDVEVKRCYTPHTRTNLYTSDNSSKGVVIENVRGDCLNAPLATAGPALNLRYKGVCSTPAMTAQVSTYGTHWFDGFICGVTPNQSAQAWTRSSTTAKVTSTGHNLRTGMLVVVTVTSDASAIVLGTKTITALTQDTFTFTCLSAGASSGTLTFVPVSGRIGLMMNEETAEYPDIYSLTGTALFTSAGTLFLPAASDSVTWETPDYIIGHTTFPIMEMLMTAGARKNCNVSYYIDLHDGNGYAVAAKNLSYPRGGAGGSGGSTTVTMTSTTGVAAGDYVFGANIAPLAKVISVDNGTDITVDTANVGTVSGVLIFNHLPSETSVNAQLGFKLKISVTAVLGLSAATWTRSTTTATVTLNNHGLTTNDSVYVTISSSEAAIVIGAKTVTVTGENTFTFTCSNAGSASGTLSYTYPAITNLYVGTDSTETSRAYQYPLDLVPIRVLVKDASTMGLVSGARVYIVAAAGGGTTAGTVILDALTGTDGSVSADFAILSATQPILGKVRRGSSTPLYKTTPISGEIDTTGFYSTVFLVGDE